MKNWIIVLLVFVMPLSLYAYLDAKAQTNMMCKTQGNQEKIAKAKIIKFSSPMCSECQETQEELEKAMKTYKDSVIVEEINVIDNNKNSKEYNKAAIKKFKVTLVPTMVFINKDGKMIHRQEGLMKQNEIIEVLDGIK